MDCQEAKSWMVSHIMGDLQPKSYQKLAFEEHLRICKACTLEYQEYKETIEFIKANKAEFAAAIESCERREALERQDRERSWQAIEAKLENTNRKRKNLNIYKILWKPVAAAACFAIVISIFLIIFSHKDHTSPGSPQISTAKPYVKIEDISNKGKVPIASGQQIVSSNQLKTLLINNKHRLILDENSILSINPLVSGDKIGCAVTLVSGRIYAHVEHDGNPFVVETAQGKAIITGTTFDIKTNETKSILIVAEGTVKFSSQAGFVDVSSGCSSEIFGRSAPTIPSICDTMHLTAWATGYELKTTLAKIEAFSDSFNISDLWLTANSGPINLEKINYEEWIERNQDWFKREFLQIFQLKEALAKEGKVVNYPELLYVSGNLWQFTYPQASYKQLCILTFDTLLKAASVYNFDKQWLQKNIPSIKLLNDNLTKVKGMFSGQEAFQKWVEQFEHAKKSQNLIDSDIFLYSLHASSYLTNTRTLIWLYIANERTNLTIENKASLAILLQNEVNEAEKIKEYILRLFTISENCPCEEFNILVDKISDSLTEIMDIEEKIKNEFHSDTFLQKK